MIHIRVCERGLLTSAIPLLADAAPEQLISVLDSISMGVSVFLLAVLPLVVSLVSAPYLISLLTYLSLLPVFNRVRSFAWLMRVITFDHNVCHSACFSGQSRCDRLGYSDTFTPSQISQCRRQTYETKLSRSICPAVVLEGLL